MIGHVSALGFPHRSLGPFFLKKQRVFGQKYSKIAALRNKPQEQSPFRTQMKPFWIGRQGWLVKAVFMAVNGKRGWRRGYLVKTKTFVFGRIAEISARYRRQTDRTGAARLFC